MNWLERALKIIPGGSQTYSKSYRYFTRPFFASHGINGFLYSTDGTRFSDYSMALGAVILGYKSKEWFLNLDIPSGINFSVPHPLETILAEKLIEIIPSAEMCKFMSNGSDATEIAVRLARAYTGRDIVLAGGYHGFHDWYIISIDRNRGIPLQHSDYTNDGVSLTSQFKDLNEFKELIAGHRNKIACVILEPTMPDTGQITEIARANGAIVIFDEVLTGFRYHIGGFQSLIKIKPDLSCFGKCMANGLPLSAVVGRADIMRLMDDGGVFASSTFGGETLSLAAALATIAELELYGKHLWHIGGMWASEMEILIRGKGLTDICEVVGLAPRSGISFHPKGNITRIDFQSLYQQELLKRHIITHGINNYCLAHTEEQIQYFLSACDFVLDIIGKARDDNNIERYLEGGRIEVIFDRR